MAELLGAERARIRRLSKEGLWIIAGQALAMLGTLAGVRLLTELLDPTAYGEFALGLTAAALVNQTVLGPVANGITRFYAPAQERGELGGYLHAVRRLVGAATAVIALMILLTLVSLLTTGRTVWLGISISALVFATLSGYNGVLSGIQNAARQRSIVALHQGIESWARFLVAAALLTWLGATSTVAMLGYAFAASLILCSQMVFFRNFVRNSTTTTHESSHWQVQIWKYAWPFCAWGVFSWAQQTSDRWAL